MASKRSTIEKLSDSIKDLLDDYAETIDKDVNEVTKKVAQKGAKAIAESARSMFGGSGNYASGWTSQTENKRWAASAVIYNAKAPGLAHLLENGHATVNGGRVPGRAHVAPVEELIIKEYEEAVKNAITKS